MSYCVSDELVCCSIISNHYESITNSLIIVDTNAFVPLTNYIFIFLRLKGKNKKANADVFLN